MVDWSADQLKPTFIHIQFFYCAVYAVSTHFFVLPMATCPADLNVPNKADADAGIVGVGSLASTLFGVLALGRWIDGF